MQAEAQALEIIFHGVRGSRPVADSRYLTYGGNTSCVEIVAGGVPIILDAGSGITRAGADRSGSAGPVSVFLSHLHHDHLMGLMHFEPLYDADQEVTLYAAERFIGPLRAYWDAPYFPIPIMEAVSRLHIKPIAHRDVLVYRERTWVANPAGGRVDSDGVGGSGARETGREPRVDVLFLDETFHPRDGVTLFRVSAGGRAVAYASDVELAGREQVEVVASFARGADVLIADAQYTDEEYERSYRGWGHNSLDSAVALAEAAGAGQLVLFHHAPTRDDDGMARLEAEARRRFPGATAAREGIRLTL